MVRAVVTYVEADGDTELKIAKTSKRQHSDTSVNSMEIPKRRKTEGDEDREEEEEEEDKQDKEFISEIQELEKEHTRKLALLHDKCRASLKRKMKGNKIDLN